MLAEFLGAKGVLDKAELAKISKAEGSDDLETAMQDVCEVITGQRIPNVVTGLKDFREWPLNVPAYEKRGLHVARLVLAHRAFHKRKGPRKYAERGLIRINKLVGVDAEVKELALRMGKVSRDPYKTDANLVKANPNFLPVVNLVRPHVMRHLRRRDGIAETLFVNNAFVQRIINEPHDGDVQKVSHSDTFFPALKWWWFPEAVEEGVFCYAEGSTVLTPQLLDFHYEWSNKVLSEQNEAWRGHGQLEGSFRFSKEELDILGVRLEEQRVEADTLIIANVFGAHCRGKVSRRLERNAVHGSIRFEDPFK